MEAMAPSESMALNMLGTIRLPRNQTLLQANLPESNYESDKETKLPPSEKRKISGV